ncbi:MAG: ATP-binding protein [Promethearchaeota archaeon]
MCQWCMKHGAGKKWYMNARNYSNELADEYNLKEYLTEQWMNFEQVFIRKIAGISSKNLGYKLKLPIIGRILRWQAERMIHSEKKNRNPVRADGHFGQVIPLEDAQIIIQELAAEPIICNYCMCRWMQRKEKEAVCINFGALSEVIEKLPRFIPKERTVRIDRETAVKKLEEFNKKGYIASVWFQPVPYINAICACEAPECGGLTLRTNFGLKAVYKAEYIIQLDQVKCQGCAECVKMCQFNAIRYIPSLNRVIINYDECFGCGICRHACKYDALKLIPREEYPGFTGEY